MRRVLPLGLALCALAALLPTVAAAQDATPAGGEAPAPADCQVAPRSLASLQALAATPVPTATVAPASPTPFAMPAGLLADEATRKAITATIHELVACINAGDLPRALALYSDRLVGRILPNLGPLTETSYNGAATPQPVPTKDRTVLIEFRDILILPDRRVAALVVGDDPTNPEPASATLFYLVKVGDRWVVDDFVRNVT